MAQIPLIDEQNPFYCPTVPAISYLDSLRQLHAQENFMTATQDSGLFYSFAHIIDQQNRLAIHSDDDDSSPGTHPIPAWEKEGLSDLSDRRPPVQLRSVKRKLSFSSSFSDIKQPAKYARSFQSVHDSSFELSVKAQRLFYFDSNPGYSLDYTRPGGNLKPDSSGNGDTRILEGAFYNALGHVFTGP